MKTNIKWIYVIVMLFGFLTMGCDDENEIAADEETQQNGDNGTGTDPNGMYFPPIGSDNWEKQSAVTLGWDTTNLNEAIRFAKEKNSYNLLIMHKGKMVVEEYWQETNANSQHDLESVAKSLMAVVVGVLQQDGTVGVDDKVADYLGTGWSQSPASEGDVTIRHLLTMTSGLNEDLKYVGRPGEVWQYSHAAYKMLYNVIDSAAGKSYRRIFDDELFSRVGMNKVVWNGREFSSPARDIARFGLMILNKGVWNGKKIIEDEGYFSNMLSTSSDLQKAYGYLWWIAGSDSWYNDDEKVTVEGSIAATMPSDSWLAKGKHDQRIYIVPSLDLVVIRQGASTMLPELGEGSFDFEFWARLMKAIKKEA